MTSLPYSRTNSESPICIPYEPGLRGQIRSLVEDSTKDVDHAYLLVTYIVSSHQTSTRLIQIEFCLPDDSAELLMKSLLNLDDKQINDHVQKCEPCKGRDITVLKTNASSDASSQTSTSHMSSASIKSISRRLREAEQRARQADEERRQEAQERREVQQLLVQVCLDRAREAEQRAQVEAQERRQEAEQRRQADQRAYEAQQLALRLAEQLSIQGSVMNLQ